MEAQSIQSLQFVTQIWLIKMLFEVFECAACYDLLSDPICLPCGQVICAHCIPTSISSKKLYQLKSKLEDAISLDPDPRKPLPAILEELFMIYRCPTERCSMFHLKRHDKTVWKLLSVVMHLFPEEQRALAMAKSASQTFFTSSEWSPESFTVNMDKAETTLEKLTNAIEIAPRLQWPYLLRSRVLFCMRDYNRAVKDAEMADSVNPVNNRGSRLLEKIESYADDQSRSEVVFVMAEEQIDIEVDQSLRGYLENSLECSLCLNPMTEPVTSPCGHVWCRPCILSSLDHDRRCPLCRLQIPDPSYFSYIQPNAVLESLSKELSIPHDAPKPPNEKFWIPVFVCSLAFPLVSYGYHIFEPRYRVLVKECMDGNRQFGVCLPAPRHGDGMPFETIGTILQIIRAESIPGDLAETSLGLLPRYVIEATGLHTFKAHDFRQSDEGLFYAYVERMVGCFTECSAGDCETESDSERDLDGCADDGNNSLNSHFGLLEDLLHARQFVKGLLLPLDQSVRQGFLLQNGPVPDDPNEFVYWLANIIPINMWVQTFLS
ncbi:hypothetical protein HDU67_001516 [Dinochytrium kinnereticum]|nr:hypothetical protein HDU67_001516 [Dinochytrium kinnereticum]